MIITDMNQFDLTGTNVDYKRTRKYKVFKAGQKIDLNEAVYSSSLRVFKVVPGSSDVELLRESGWTTAPLESSRAVDAMSAAKVKFDSLSTDELIAIGKFKQTSDLVVDTNKRYFKYITLTQTYEYVESPTQAELSTYYEAYWNEELVLCVYMKDTIDPTPEYSIKVSYQALELDITKLRRDGLGPEYSPGLMRSVVEQLDQVYSFYDPVKNLSADSFASLKCMPEDLTGIATSNRVENEIHDINVPANKFVVRPLNGAFYPWSGDSVYQLQVYFVGTATNDDSETVTQYTALTKLTEGTDYEIVGVNQPKTAVSEPTCGVWEFIVFKKNLVGQVYLTYQAFGGEVSQSDINALKALVQSIWQYLNSKSIVTTDNIGKLAIIRSIIDRLDYLEETIRHYQAQRFQYRTDPFGEDKWVSIAFVEKNPWSTSADVPTNVMGEFRIEIPEANVFADIRLTNDILSTSNVLNVSSCHYESLTFDDLAYAYFAQRILPKFRVIYLGSDTESLNKGIMLQMSLTGSSEKQYTVKLTDRTGAKSPWFLLDSQGNLRPVAGETNTSVTFPNGNVWKAATGQTTNIESIYPNGYTIYAGSMEITDIDAKSVEFLDAETAAAGGVTTNAGEGVAFTPMIDGTAINLPEVKFVEFTVYDRYSKQYRIGRSQKVHMTQLGAQMSITTDAMYFTDDLCVLSIRLTKNNSSYEGTLYSRTGTNSLNCVDSSNVTCGRFALTKIDLLK